jgi:signal transduction histidine kinase
VNRLGDLAKNLSNHAPNRDTDFHNSPLRASLEDALEVVRPKLGSDTQLDVEVEANPTVHGAPDALTQIFVNLILNALEEIEKRSDARIAVHIDRRADTTVFTVTDIGTGIPPEIVGAIFDPFVTTKSEQGGTGIGLWLSSRIVEQHGGKIHARNIENGGARLTVELPVAGGNADTDQKLAATELTADNPADNGASSAGN